MTTLKAALQEAYFMELEEIPSEEKLSEDEALTFSSAFERKMKKLIRRADHPIRYRIAQIAACLLLAALLSGCTVLAISPEARAAFVGWVREVSEGWFVYHYTGEDQNVPENVIYCPTWVPDGYELITEPENRTHMIAIYENPEGDTILFNCYMNTESMNLQIGEDTQLIDTYVSNIPAELYVGNASGDVNHLIWEDENKQMIFWIASTLDGETMIKIAESVEAREVPEPQVVYRPTWIPEGYSELKESISDDQVVIVYRNDEGYLLAFTYTKNRESVSAYVLLDNQETDVQAVLVGGKTADLYLEQQADKASILVWGDDEKGVFFAISAHCSGEELIKIAESVEAQEVLKPQVIYRPTWIPDGYNELKQSISDDHVSIVYENDEGYLLSFTYTRNRESVNVYAEHQGTDVQTVIVGDNAADLYWDQREGNTNTLIWSDEEKSAIFVISAHCSGDELIKIAESVEAQEVPKPQVVYQPTWIPEGYQETTVKESTSQTYICYENEDKLLVFCCTMNADAATLYITSDNSDILDVQNIKIGDFSADLYIDPKENAASGIVWINENGTLFWIHGQLSGDELIKMAESVEAVQ